MYRKMKAKLLHYKITARMIERIYPIIVRKRGKRKFKNDKKTYEKLNTNSLGYNR